ncbi:MAG: hypothetical protein JNL59_08715 [Chitinophagaceae bacterium]|nr:hypothetical protein [Chitinophagaceae bacterium]
MKLFLRIPAILLLLLILPLMHQAQMITGVWKGRINRQKVEVRIIQKGDSLLGTSYYYESSSRFRKYSIKGYYAAGSNQAVWWDDQLLEEKPARASAGQANLLSSADFNCPGGTRMFLDGKATDRNTDRLRGDVALEKTDDRIFEDDWDFVIDNYTAGANDPSIIDSISGLAGTPPASPVVASHPAPPPVRSAPAIAQPEKAPVSVVVINNKPSIEEKFSSRSKKLVTEIPLIGDSIELRFYDNAEIDGDSISLFLNGKLLFSHIRLTGNAYKVKLAIDQLEGSNELIMVAENLGTIPPNTSYMVAEAGGKRFEASLESTEGSSALIRLYKPESNSKPLKE